jgi:hypothetical protein
MLAVHTSAAKDDVTVMEMCIEIFNLKQAFLPGFVLGLVKQCQN